MVKGGEGVRRGVGNRKRAHTCKGSAADWRKKPNAERQAEKRGLEN